MIKATKIVTPVGTIAWCAINPDSPDMNEGTIYDAQWYADLIVEKEDARSFVEKVKAFYEAAREEFGPKKETNPIPIKAHVDADGNKTGKLVIKAKLKVGGTRKDGTKWSSNPPVLFDENVHPFTPKGILGAGTTMALSLSMNPYSAPKVGIKLDILGARVINPVYRGLQVSADDFGVEGATEPSADNPPSSVNEDDLNF